MKLYLFTKKKRKEKGQQTHSLNSQKKNQNSPQSKN